MAFFAFISTSISQALTDSLLVYYQFYGNTNDSSGNGFHAVGNATLTTDRAGNSNAAANFNGTTLYLDLPNDPQLKPQLPISFSFWAKSNDISETSIFFGTDFQEDNYHGAWVNFSFGTGEMNASFGDGSGSTGASSRRTFTTNFQIQSNIWYHYAVIIRGAVDMEIYIDCASQAGNYHGSGGSLAYSATPGTIGRFDTGTTFPPWYFNGIIDDFRYWNRAITASEVAILCDEVPISSDIQAANKNFILYPVPAREILFISHDYTFSAEPWKFEIFSLNGQSIWSESGTEMFSKKEIDLSDFNEGFYFLKFSSEGNELIRKFSVMRP